MTVDGVGQALCTDGEFLQKTLDSLCSHIAILTDDGTIIAVNAAWNTFASSNGLAEQFCGIGTNYLHACDQATGECSQEAPIVAKGIRDVIAKKQKHFFLEYPCHSPSQQRWYIVRVTRFEIEASLCVVVTHDSITERKLAELKLLEVNRLLEHQSATDGLTGVANRRSLDSTFEHEWRRNKRQQSPLSIAMLDIDCFKQYNDQYGHLAGDDCLKVIAKSLQSHMHRPGDFVARYGGEEFVVVLPNTDSAGAATILQDALHCIRESPILHTSSKVGRGIVTVSIGCATIIPSENDSHSEFLHLADQALYKAKANGRDQLICVEQLKTAG